MAQQNVLRRKPLSRAGRLESGLSGKRLPLYRQRMGSGKQEYPSQKGEERSIELCWTTAQSLRRLPSMCFGRPRDGGPFAPSWSASACQSSLPAFWRPVWALAAKRFCQMISVRWIHCKVFWAVVCNIIVQVVDDLAWFKRATQHLFGDHPMLSNITVSVGKAMARNSHQNVALLIKHLAAFPVRIVLHIKTLCRGRDSGVKQNNADVGLATVKATGNLGLRDVLFRPLNHLLAVADCAIRILGHVSPFLSTHIIRAYRNMSKASSMCAMIGFSIWKCPALGTIC